MSRVTCHTVGHIESKRSTLLTQNHHIVRPQPNSSIPCLTKKSEIMYVCPYFLGESQINLSLKARPAAQQRYFEKDIFGSDSELSDAPDAEGM